MIKKGILASLLLFGLLFIIGSSSDASAIAGKKKAHWVVNQTGYRYVLKNGSYIKGKIFVIKGKKYLFDNRGYRRYGFCWYRGNKYYFSLRTAVMSTNHWLDANRQYCGKDGKIYRNGLYEVQGIAYGFDGNGMCVERNVQLTEKDSSGRIFQMEPYRLSDPKIGKDISFEDFFTACVYAEAGDQGHLGMMAVAMVMLNRTGSEYFPNQLPLVIYQKNQFAVTRDGGLTKILINPQLKKRTNHNYENARKAVRAAMTSYSNYLKYKTIRYLVGFPYRKGERDFDFLFFMTPGKFIRSGVDWDLGQAVQYSPNSGTLGHVFFKRWATIS